MNRLEPFVAYEASAGSGKTFALTLRYISLLFLGNPANKILTLTFTNKASNEMKTRIQNTLKNLDKDEFKAELNELCNMLGKDKEAILQKKSEIYQNFLKQDNYILTIDKFCTFILRKFAFYIGMMPDFTIEQKKSLSKVSLNFIQFLKSNSCYSEFIKFTIFEEKKLNTVFDLFYYFYEKFYELPDRKKEYSFNDATLLDIFNSLKSGILKCDKLSDSGKKALDIKNIDDIYKQTWFCKESLKDYSYFKKCFQNSWDDGFKKLKDEVEKYILYRESKYINNLLSFFDIFKEVNYKVKRELNDLGFKDIPNFTYRVLNKNDDKDFFYFRLDAKFNHLLLDEFQDTSILQFEILKPLFDEIVSGSGVSSQRSIFYVGDVKQSIYRFRGGSKELFYAVADKYNLLVKRLNTNYRSKKEIVSFVNDTFSGVIKGYFKQTPYDEKGSGYVEVTKDEDIVNGIKKTLAKLFNTGIDEDDIAILTYTNDDAFVLEEELKKEFDSINISTQAGMSVMSVKEVKIILECMKYIYFKEEYNRLNLLALLDKKIDEELEFDWLDASLSPLDFSFKCIEKFHLNHIAIPEFLNDIKRYDDLESLLFNLEEFNTQIPQPKLKGIKILTIHKSKGLEFKHLLICDRLKRKTGDRSSFIIYQDKLKIKDIFLKAKNRECIDDKYKRALESEKKLQLEDELNALYVAFTRAKESLFIFAKEKNSAFASLELKETSKGVFPKANSKETLSLQKSFEYSEPKVPRQNIASKDNTQRYESDFEAINFGLATHYMLEMLNNFEKNSLKSAGEAMKNRYLDILDIKQINDIIQRVENLLENEKFINMISSKKLHKELPLVYDDELRQIDLLAEDEKSVIVIDYKTSDNIQSEHSKQVSNYINIIKKIKGKDAKGYLCYLRKNEIKFVKVENV